MKKITMFLACILLLTMALCAPVLATEDEEMTGSWYFGIIDDADLLEEPELHQLAARNLAVNDEYDYAICFYTGNFDTEDAFYEYVNALPEEELAVEESDSGVILATGYVDDYYCTYGLPYGNYEATIGDATFADFAAFDETSESHMASFEHYVTLVEHFLAQQSAAPTQEKSPEAQEFTPLVDAADIFSDTQEAVLTARIAEMQEDYDFDVTILTVPEIPETYDDLRDFFDWYKGLDPTRDGLVVGVNMDPSHREFSISARNFGSEAFTDDAHKLVHEEIPPLLTDEAYFQGFLLFLDHTEDFLEGAKAGQPYKGAMDSTTFVLFVVALPLALAALLGWLLVKFIFVAQMKTAVIKTEAKDFMEKDSLVLTICTDDFSHESVSREYDPPSDNKGSGGSSSSSGYGGSRSGSSSSF